MQYLNWPSQQTVMQNQLLFMEQKKQIERLSPPRPKREDFENLEIWHRREGSKDSKGSRQEVH